MSSYETFNEFAMMFVTAWEEKKQPKTVHTLAELCAEFSRTHPGVQFFVRDSRPKLTWNGSEWYPTHRLLTMEGAMKSVIVNSEIPHVLTLTSPYQLRMEIKTEEGVYRGHLQHFPCAMPNWNRVGEWTFSVPIIG